MGGIDGMDMMDEMDGEVSDEELLRRLGEAIKKATPCDVTLSVPTRALKALWWELEEERNERRRLGRILRTVGKGIEEAIVVAGEIV